MNLTKTVNMTKREGPATSLHKISQVAPDLLKPGNAAKGVLNVG